MYAKGNPGRSSRSAVFRPTLKSATRFFLVASVPPRNLFAVSSRHDLVDTSPERGEGKRLIKRSRNHESRFDYIGGERGGGPRFHPILLFSLHRSIVQRGVTDFFIIPFHERESFHRAEIVCSNWREVPAKLVRPSFSTSPRRHVVLLSKLPPRWIFKISGRNFLPRRAPRLIDRGSTENRLESVTIPPPLSRFSRSRRRARNTEAVAERGNGQVIPLEYVTLETERRDRARRGRRRIRARRRRRRRNRIVPLERRGAAERKGEKKGSRHPLGSREATQEANSPITCRTYRGFAIQASPSNTINIPSRMPGIHAAAESSICGRDGTGKERTDGRAVGRMRGRGGEGWKWILLPLPGIGIMQPSFFARSRNGGRETFANIYGMKYGEGEGGVDVKYRFETRAGGGGGGKGRQMLRCCLSLSFSSSPLSFSARLQARKPIWRALLLPFFFFFYQNLNFQHFSFFAESEISSFLLF